MTKAERMNAILKGMGRRPTNFIIRWNPTWKDPLNFGLVEVSKCETDGGVVTPTMSQHRRSLHAGHRMRSPGYYSLWDVLKIQFRMIQ